MEFVAQGSGIAISLHGGCSWHGVLQEDAVDTSSQWWTRSIEGVLALNGSSLAWRFG